MSKVLGLFAIKYTIFNELPHEIKAIIIKDLPSTQLSYILRKFPNKKWDYNVLSKYINIKFVVKFPKKWNYDILSKYININDILKYHHLPWNVEYFSRNNSVFPEHIMSIPIDWDYNYLSQNPNMTIDFVSKHLNKPWDYTYICSHSHEIDAILSGKIPWRDEIGLNPYLSLDKIKSDKQWNLSQNPNITDDFRNNNPVCWLYCFQNKKTMWSNTTYQDELMLRKMNISPFKMDWERALSKTNVCLEYLSNNLDKDFNWMYLSSNTNITIDFILTTNKPWDLTRLILNPTLSTKDKLLLCEKFD